ncbi:MAG: hypothetical protein KF796_16155 [Ramlibacter sp.]|nr:hypothetical protein [Ramlibacter sp.]
MRKDRALLLKLSPAIASLVFNVAVLIFFFRHFGSMQGFFEASRGVDGNFAILTLMLLAAVSGSTLFCTLSIVLVSAKKLRSKQRPQ